MKKSQYKKLFLMFLIIGICAIALIYFTGVKKSYLNNVRSMVKLEAFSYYAEPFMDYFNEKSQFPASLKEVFVLKSNNIDYKDYIHQQFCDCLSARKSLIYYVPLYNKVSLRREAFLLISAGIDGNLNIKISPDDTLFVDSRNKPFKFYNTRNPYKLGGKINPDTAFNVFDYYFGKKDYLIDYVSFKDYYMSHVASIYSSAAIINQIKSNNYFIKFHKLSKQIYGYYGRISKVSLVGKTKCIYFKADNYVIKNELLDTIGIKYSIGDSVTLVGLLARFNPKEKIVGFKNCFRFQKPLH